MRHSAALNIIWRLLKWALRVYFTSKQASKSYTITNCNHTDLNCTWNTTASTVGYCIHGTFFVQNSSHTISASLPASHKGNIQYNLYICRPTVPFALKPYLWLVIYENITFCKTAEHFIHQYNYTQVISTLNKYNYRNFSIHMLLKHKKILISHLHELRFHVKWLDAAWW